MKNPQRKWKMPEKGMYVKDGIMNLLETHWTQLWPYRKPGGGTKSASRVWLELGSAETQGSRILLAGVLT